MQCDCREVAAHRGGPRGQREGLPGEEAGPGGLFGDRAGADGPEPAPGPV